MTSQPAHLDDHLTTLAARFVWNADHGFQGDSPLYDTLARGAANDAEVLSLAEAIPRNQPPALVLFGVAHFLLLGGVRHPVEDYFPSRGGTRSADDAYPAFRAFCLEYADQMRPLLATRKTQTNEVGRCAILLPAFGIISRRVSGAPLNLIEVGASSGLNLVWDRYRYDYGRAGRGGLAESEVAIACDARGSGRPPIPTSLPPTASRIGIDLEPADVRDADQMRWQRALIWPDQIERAALFERAVEVARREPPALVRGDALTELPKLIRKIPAEGPTVVTHSFTLYQFAPEARQAFDEVLAASSAGRVLFRVSIEWYSGDEFPALRLITYQNGGRVEEHLANCHQHGQWIEWLLAENDS